MEMDKGRLCCLILNALADVGPVTFRRLMEHFSGKFHDIFSATFGELSAIHGVSRNAAEHIAHWEQYFNCEKELQQLAVLGTNFGTQNDNTYYPANLKEIYDPPIGLYVKGEYNLAKKNYIAIVGTRKASLYGVKIAREFARELANLDFVVVSGLALGIDSAAHEGALSSGKKCPTVAVVGSGIDVIYPRENAKLYRNIAEQGSVISEFQLGRKADKVTFPIRNRVIAGMCEHTIVIESDASGGSMITAHIANEYGRNVMAIPGRIDQRSSTGCHELIRDGATLIASFDHLLEELHCFQQNLFQFMKDEKSGHAEKFSDPVERQVVELIQKRGNITADEISEALEIPVYHIVPRLQLLELRKILKLDAKGGYECFN